MSMTYDDTTARDAVDARERVEQRVAREREGAGARWDWRSVGALLGLSGGIVSALVGSVLTAASWLMGAGLVAAYVRTAGTVLLVLMIPLLIIGAHCLDLTEKREKAERASRFKE